MLRFWCFESTTIRISERLNIELKRGSGVMNDFKAFVLKKWQVRVAYLKLKKTGVEQFCFVLIRKCLQEMGLFHWHQKKKHFWSYGI